MIKNIFEFFKLIMSTRHCKNVFFFSHIVSCFGLQIFGRLIIIMVSFSILCLLSILHGYGSGFLFEITSSRKELNFLYEESLEIECSFNIDHSEYETEIKSVEEIHIVRREGSKRWTELAKLQANGYQEKKSPNFHVYGAIEPAVNNTFLRLNWDIASEAELGMYQCDVVIKDENYKFDIIESNILTIFKHNVTTEELLDLSQRQLDNLQLEFDKFRKKTVKKMAELEKTVQELRSESRNQEEDTDPDIADTYLDQLKKDIRRSVLENVSAELEDMTCSRLSRCSPSNDINDPSLTQNRTAYTYTSVDLTASKRTLGTTLLTSVTTEVPEITPGTTASTFFTNEVPKITNGTTVPTSVITDLTETTTVTTNPTTVTTELTEATTVTTNPTTVTTELTETTIVTTNLTTVTTQPTTTLQTTVEQVPELPWPAGRFALLNSKSGCPKTSVAPQWFEGYMKYHTESVDENHDNVTYLNHLAEPVSEVDRSGNHFLFMHFCISYNTNPTNEQWPAGSYCMNRVSSRCPSGFKSGYMDIDEEDTNFSGQSRGILPDMLFFCCRADGAPGEGITLPSSRPFYLYRFGGRCQEINNMRVTPEKMIFDTENENNQDDYQNDNHPDGKLTDVEIELCYYS